MRYRCLHAAGISGGAEHLTSRIMTSEGVKKYLKNLGIDYKEFSHGAVFTCEQAEKDRSYSEIRGPHAKNLFLKAKKSNRLILAILPFEKKLDMKALGERIGDRLSFAGETELKEALNLDRGAVSPFGLINDDGKVKVLIDRVIFDADFVSFHPNVNTETLELSGKGFKEYLRSLKNEVEVIDF